MYLAPSNDNRRDPEVQEVQRMLNSIRVNFHHCWDYLSEDGIYGIKTANVVRQFQIYRGISSQMVDYCPILGDTTIAAIREYYRCVPQISAATNIRPYNAPQKIKPLDIIDNIATQVIGCIGIFDEFLKREISYVDSLRTSNTNALKQRFYSFATRMDPSMRKLKEHLGKLNNIQTKPWESPSHTKGAKRNRKNLVKELKNFDIVSKIEKFLESKGFSGKIELGKGKSIKVKAGGILAVWNYKDLILDVCKISDWGTEKWNADVKKHFFELLDGFIIGYASTVIAELVVGITLAVVGVTISSGWIVVIIAIAALLISLLFSYIMSTEEVSFSQMALEGYSEIISLVKL